MKKGYCLAILLLTFWCQREVEGQNVGIGTPTPFGKLSINTESTNWNFPSLLLTDDALNNGGGAILQFRNLADKRMYLQSHFGTQADGTDTYMTFSHEANYNMRIRGDGNVGIGSLNPNLAGLVVNKKVGNAHAIFGDNTSGVSIESNFPGIHFNSYYNGTRKTISTGYTSGAEMNPTTGSFSIYTSPLSTSIGNTAAVFNRFNIDKDGVVGIPFVLELGYGQTKQIDNGKIALNQFGEANSLSIVGGGIASNGSDRRIKFFADKESDFSGPIKFNGALKPAGNAGTAGQVLTSNGASAPSWTNTAFTNNIRFGVRMILNQSTGGNLNYTEVYNLRPDLVTVVPGSSSIGGTDGYIMVGKTGLYRLNGSFNGRLSSPTLLSTEPSFSLRLIANNLGYVIASLEPLPRTPTSTSLLLYEIAKTFSFDVYLEASTRFFFRVSTSFGAGAGIVTRVTEGVVSGYLISE